MKIWPPEIDLPVTNEGGVSITNTPVAADCSGNGILIIESIMTILLKYTPSYRGIRVRYPLNSYWEVNFRRSNFHISYWEEILENLPDLQRGDPLQKSIRPSIYSEIWRRNFQNRYWKQIGREAAP